MAQVLGIIDWTWNGRTIDAEKGSKVKLGGMVQKPVLTGRVVHHSEELEASEIEITFVLPRGLRVSDVFVRGRRELICRCDTGQTFSWPDAFITNRPEITGGEGGKIPLKLSAGEATEMMANG